MRQPIVEQMRAAIAKSRYPDLVDRLRASLKLESLAVGLSNPFLVDAASEAADEIERLRHDNMRLQTANDYAYDPRDGALSKLNREIERLREEVATWRSRYEAERKDHEATMKAWDEERSGL